jgi:2,4-dienoyl-CoA reductase-like NADH-dependent reductase (Old Yellow Enzyme family)
MKNAKEGDMPALFSPFRLGKLEVKNRFVSSACEDNGDACAGEASDRAVRKIEAVAEGGAGLAITPHLFVHPLGRTRPGQLGIHGDAMVDGLRRMAEAVHRHGGKIVFQLGHAGMQTKAETIGRPPLGPSSDLPMSEAEIHDVIDSFALAARRSAEAGADGIQVHAAHGYLISEFLSAYYNRRDDSWGGSDENRFRLLKEIVEGARSALPAGMALIVKLNSSDFIPEGGVVQAQAQDYAARLSALGVDGLEISCGTSQLSPWSMCRGEIPIKEILSFYPEGRRQGVETALAGMRGRFELVEAYNLDAAKAMRPFAKGVSLIPVGGWRTVSRMEDAIEKGEADFIAMCRPFIRDPHLVRKIESGDIARVSCTSCNRCLIALAKGMPVQCYANGF